MILRLNIVGAAADEGVYYWSLVSTCSRKVLFTCPVGSLVMNDGLHVKY